MEGFGLEAPCGGCWRVLLESIGKEGSWRVLGVGGSWRILEGLERLGEVLELWRVMEGPAGSWMEGSGGSWTRVLEGFGGVLEGFGGSWKVLEGCGGSFGGSWLWRVLVLEGWRVGPEECLEGLARFWRVLESPGDSWRVLEGCGGFWKVLRLEGAGWSWGSSWRVLEGS